ncbi:MAG: tetratricopeptide repeat protein [Planctomycetaceae bacterium]|nr:tetratricopeptide repeat protein [Planctomycetaceae bacterium]
MLSRHFRASAAWLLVFLVSAASVCRADAPGDDFKLAVGLFEQSRWKVATEAFQKFLEAYPTHDKVPLARLYLGLSLVNQNDFKAARDQFRRFVRDNPENQYIAVARYRVGEASFLLGDREAAKVELESFLKAHPKDERADRARLFLGDVLLQLGETTASLSQFDQAIESQPEGPYVEDAKFGRAKALEALKRDDDALKQYQELAANRLGTRAADAQLQIAGKAFDAGKFAEAAAAYQDLITRFPESPLLATAQLNAGFSFYEAKQFAAAATEFGKAAALKAGQQRQALYWQGVSLKLADQVPAAVASLKDAAAAAGEDPTAMAIEFQIALCERLLKKSAEAQERFLKIVDAEPQGKYAPDSLFYAAELALERNELSLVDPLLTRLLKEFPQSGLRHYAELLLGRTHLATANQSISQGTPASAEGPKEELAKAAEDFSRVSTETKLPALKFQADYYLGLTRQLQGDPRQALATLANLTKALRDGSADPELTDALLLESECQLAIDQPKAAAEAAAVYETRLPNGPRVTQAISLQAIAAARQGQPDEALRHCDRLGMHFPGDPKLSVTLLDLAEWHEKRAKTGADWIVTGKFYERLIPATQGTTTRAFALRGLAWAQFQQQLYAEAAKTFAQALAEFPDHVLSPECDYYRGESLRLAGDLKGAAVALSETFRKRAPSSPPATGAEQDPPVAYAYLAGLQAARSYRQSGDVAAADAAYAALLQKFPQPKSLDRLLDEWARLNYDAEQYARADEVFRMIVDRTPDSDLADDARLSLAESDLIAGKLEPAAREFLALWESPKSDSAVRERAVYQLLVIALEQQNWKDVRRWADALIEAFPESEDRPYAEYARAEALLANPETAADVPTARKLLTSLQTRSTEPALENADWIDRVWVLAAEAAFRERDYVTVASEVARLKQRSPQSKFLYQAEEVLGRSEKQQAKFDDARRAFERVLSDPNAFSTETAAKSQFLIAECYFLQEQWHQAFLAYQKVYTSYKFPEWQAAALLQSGKCDERQMQWKEAAATYERLIAEFPQSMHVKDAQERLKFVQDKL